MDPFTVFSLISGGLSFGTSIWAAKERQKEIDIQETEMKIKAEQDGIKRDEKMRRVIGLQNITAVSEGVTPGSLDAIEKNSFEEFAEDKKISDLNLMIKESTLEQERSNVMRQAIFGGLIKGTELFAETQMPMFGTIPTSSNVKGGDEWL